MTALAALGTGWLVEHWPFGQQRWLSAKERAVYAAAIRHAIGHKHPDGVIFVSIARNDPPASLIGQALLPVSRSHTVEGVDRQGYYSSRFCDKYTREPGWILYAKILGWEANDRVRVIIQWTTSPDVGAGEAIYLRLKNGEWTYDGDDPDSAYDI